MGDAFNEAPGWEAPVHNVCISGFERDVYEVTNREYKTCEDAGACTAPVSASSGKREFYYGEPEYDDFPVVNVDWYQATEYCAWAGKRLSTEAEWEYAARRGLAGNRYPWGHTISPSDANCLGSGDPWETDTRPAGHYAANGYALFDMAGNVLEWVDDYFSMACCQYCVDHGIVNDPPGPAEGTQGRGLRGGSCCSGQFDLRVSDRYYGFPEGEGSCVGFRCARGG